ncbi:hypothetical protein Q9S36_10290 [Microbacterium sp. ARD31]|jgi:hypothetical protein|uniref:hypothetical protein n=1 Tax=Microbacterium sp. ARD31 TaxID=2962576 RepID=UPI002881AE04|nr:hypothetical protein [Microbacterium sp. ARD31]MDT0180588.1 hypothetical protein [Microbacterium sp. ARD31]
MGFLDDAKKTAEAVGEKIKDTWDDATDRISDKSDEVQAEAEVKKAEADVKRAEAERDSVHRRNDFREDLRD